jgi:hypothetical protein
VPVVAASIACASASAPAQPPRSAITTAAPAAARDDSTPCEGNNLDVALESTRCVCSKKDAPTDYACDGPSNNDSPDLLVRADAFSSHVAAGAVLLVDLSFENAGHTTLRVDLPSAFAPELVVFSPQGIRIEPRIRIEPPNGTVTCPLHDTGRFVSGKIRLLVEAGGRAHVVLPWKARTVAWDEARHLASGRCDIVSGAPLPKGVYELKVISDLLGTSSDDPARNPRLKVTVD